jgi:hypothetical protein
MRVTGEFHENERSGPDLFFFEHPVDEIEDKLSLGESGVGGATAVQVAFTADQEFKTHLISSDIDPELKGPALAVLALGRGKKIGGQGEPVDTDHRSLFEGSFDPAPWERVHQLKSGASINNMYVEVFYISVGTAEQCGKFSRKGRAWPGFPIQSAKNINP